MAGTLCPNGSSGGAQFVLQLPGSTPGNCCGQQGRSHLERRTGRCGQAWRGTDPDSSACTGYGTGHAGGTGSRSTRPGHRSSTALAPVRAAGVPHDGLRGMTTARGRMPPIGRNGRTASTVTRPSPALITWNCTWRCRVPRVGADRADRERPRCVLCDLTPRAER